MDILIKRNVPLKAFSFRQYGLEFFKEICLL